MNIPQLKESVTAIVESNQSASEKRQAICDYLKQEIDYYHWVGFYFKNGDKAELKLAPFACAPITKTVAEQTKYLLKIIGYPAEIVQDTETPAVKLFINGKFTAFIVEGCNAISIIILFIAFIVAFAGNFKTTFLYILFGSLLIYVTNIVRIVIISMAL